jgi:hypothetical protein
VIVSASHSGIHVRLEAPFLISPAILSLGVSFQVFKACTFLQAGHFSSRGLPVFVKLLLVFCRKWSGRSWIVRVMLTMIRSIGRHGCFTLKGFWRWLLSP